MPLVVPSAFIRSLFLGFLLVVVPFLTTAARSEPIEFVAILNGSNEVFPNRSRGTGTISATLDGNRLTVSGQFANLESPVATDGAGGAVIQTGYAGQGGAVAHSLEITFGIVATGGQFEASRNTLTLTAEERSALMDRRLYINILTEKFLGGEIRGQLRPAGGRYFRVNLTGRAETTPSRPNQSGGAGAALLELRGDSLLVSGRFGKLGSELTSGVNGGAHLHIGGLDTSGSSILQLTLEMDPDRRNGSIPVDMNGFLLNPGQKKALESGEFYLNLPTTAYKSGEIRGQAIPESARLFEAYLQTENMADLNISSNGTGGLVAILDGDSLTIGGRFVDLSSPAETGGPSSAQLFIGAPKRNGSSKRSLNIALEGDGTSGRFRAEENTFELDATELEALWSGEFYAVVGTSDYPTGEIRGQLLPSGNEAPSASSIIVPESGGTFVLPANLEGEFVSKWQRSYDPNGNGIVYVWQIAFDPQFSGQVITAYFTGTSDTIPYILLDQLIKSFGLEIGPLGLKIYFRVITTDGSLSTTGETGFVLLMRETSDVEAESGAGVAGTVDVFPNPALDETTLRYSLPGSSNVSAQVFDRMGRPVRSLPPVMQAEGPAELRLDLSGLPSGTYSVRIRELSSGRNTSEFRIVPVTVVR